VRAFCGIDWAETHHDVAVVDAEGRLLARRRIRDDPGRLPAVAAATGRGWRHRHRADPGRHRDQPRGCWWPSCAPPVGACTPSTPWPCTGYRDRHGVAGAKSDHGDAVVLAGILRTDQAAHRPLPADSELVQAITVLTACPAGRGLEPPAARQPATLAAAGVLPRRPCGLPPQARRPDRPRGPRRAGRRANPHAGGQPDHRTAALAAARRRSPAQPRRLDHAATGQLPRRPATPATRGRAGHAVSSSWPCSGSWRLP
jgi:hypothetical protein